MKTNPITFIQSAIIFAVLFYIVLDLGLVPEKYALVGYTLSILIIDDILLVLIGGFLIVKLQEIKKDFGDEGKKFKNIMKKLTL